MFPPIPTIKRRKPTNDKIATPAYKLSALMAAVTVFTLTLIPVVLYQIPFVKRALSTSMKIDPEEKAKQEAISKHPLLIRLQDRIENIKRKKQILAMQRKEE